jgi:glycine cleavage system aminomethyltransferase T
MIFTMSSMPKVTDPFAGERLKESPFHPRQAALNLRDAWSSWNGYKFADYYYDEEYEYFCIRNSCATYDICPMQKYILSGPDAEAMLDRMVTRDITKLKENRVTYVCWCTDEGRLIAVVHHWRGSARVPLVMTNYRLLICQMRLRLCPFKALLVAKYLRKWV